MTDPKTLAGAAVQTAREIVGNNRVLVYLLLAIGAVGYFTGRLPDVELPSWWPVAGILLVAAVLAGRWAAKKIQALLPDPEGILLVAFDASETGGGQIYELSEAAFADLEVAEGDLFAWDESPRRVYEVRSYDPVNNVARANWRESKPGSVLASEPSVEDALEAVKELRNDLEPEAERARKLRRRIRGIVRRLDRERAEAFEEVLDEHTAPSIGDRPTIGELLEEMLEDDLDLPGSTTTEEGVTEADESAPEGGQAPPEDEEAPAPQEAEP